MHKSVVTCGSEYFRAMLEHEMAESASGAVELEQVSPRVLGRVVRWLYTGELGAISDVGEGLALLEGSRFLGVERMETQCSAWLCAHVNASSCVEVWAEASRMGYEAVEACALRAVGRGCGGALGGASASSVKRRCEDGPSVDLQFPTALAGQDLRPGTRLRSQSQRAALRSNSWPRPVRPFP